jgi:sulfite reductase (NADPH) flavoprotein alpha-component
VAAPGAPSEGMTKVRTVCSYCGVGCGMVLDVGTGLDGRRAVLKATGDKEHPANFGRLCTKGATTADMLAAPGRLTTALVRPDRGGEPQPAPVAAAVAETARRLRAIVDEHGRDAVVTETGRFPADAATQRQRNIRRTPRMTYQ